MGIAYRWPGANEDASRPNMYEGARDPLNDGVNLLRTYAGSDLAAADSKRSIMGIVTMINGGPISLASILGKTAAVAQRGVAGGSTDKGNYTPRVLSM